MPSVYSLRMFNSSIKQRHFSLFISRLLSLAVQVSKVATLDMLAWRIFQAVKTTVHLGNTVNSPSQEPSEWQLAAECEQLA